MCAGAQGTSVTRGPGGARGVGWAGTCPPLPKESDHCVARDALAAPRRSVLVHDEHHLTVVLEEVCGGVGVGYGKR